MNMKLHDFIHQEISDFLQENKNAKLEYYLAPPLFSKTDKETEPSSKTKIWIVDISSF